MAKKVFKIVTELCSWLLLAVMIVCILALLVTKVSGGVPQLFGFRIYVISTGSMVPTLEVGDVILSRTYHSGDALTPGEDILTYEGSGDTEGFLITHRLVSVEETPKGRMLILRGDANNVNDAPVAEERIVSRTVCQLRIFGWIFQVMQSKLGMPILILIILVFIIIEALDLSRAAKSKREAEDSGAAEEKNNDSKT